MITAGIDCGAKNTKTVILRDGRIIGKGKVLTGFDQGKAANESLGMALKAAAVVKEDIERIAVTGSGRNSVKIADTEVSDIKAIARGGHFFFPNARTVADVGAEEGRSVKVDEKGNVVDFAVNEKCAAGTGVFIEAMARALEVVVEEMGPLCLQSKNEVPMNAQCVVFAESEVIGLIQAKTDKADISKAIHDAVAGRIVSMIQRIGVNEEVVMIGGLARNYGLIESIKRKLQIGSICIPDEPEFGAGVGAAVEAAEEV